VDQIASKFMRMNGNDVSVKTPWRMVTSSQTRRIEEDCLDSLSAYSDKRVILLRFIVFVVPVWTVTYPVQTRSRVLA
jgi:hypothetical protein